MPFSRLKTASISSFIVLLTTSAHAETIVERPAPVADPPPPVAAPPLPAVTPISPPTGPIAFALGDENFQIRLRPVLQLDARFFLHDGTISFLARRIRPAVEATAY